MTSITIFLTFLLLVIVLVGVAWGGFLVHRRLSFLEAEYGRNRVAALQDAQRFDQRTGELALRIEAAERRAADALQRPFQGVNYTQRSQMLRMIRRGDSAGHIASALGVPLSQVRLLMKLPAAGLCRDAPVMRAGSPKDRGAGASQ